MTTVSARPVPPTSVGRLLTAVACVLLAVALGVVAADGWRWHLGVLADVAGSQSAWAIGAFLTGLLLRRTGRRRPEAGLAPGAVAGAAFGAVALGSYYAYEWLAYDAHSATSQLAGSGMFWVPAAVLGGGVCGVLGVLAATPVRAVAWEPAAIGLLAAAAIPAGEAVFVSWHRTRYPLGVVAPAVLALVSLATVLVALAVRRVGWSATIRVGLVVVVVATVAGVVLAELETRVGYLTL